MRVIQGGVKAKIQYMGVCAHSEMGGIQNRHEGEDSNPQGCSGPQNVGKASTHTEVPKKMMGEVGEGSRSWDT